MRRKTIVIFVLAIMMCFCGTIYTLAATMSPKDLILKSIDNLDLNYSQNFYKQSSGTVTYQINRLQGTSLQGVSVFPGTSVNLAYQMDIPNKRSAFDVKVGYNNKTYQGQAYLVQEKLIITKSFLAAINELVPSSGLGDLSKYPEYLYVKEAGLNNLWMSSLNYPTVQKAEETKALLKFFVEAIPANYFVLEGTTVVVELNQAAFEETVYLILEKVKNEKVRFADILVNIAGNYNNNSQQLKAEIINDINSAVSSGNWPTKEEIQAMGTFIQVKQCKYQASIIPGGQCKFDASFGLNQGAAFGGQFDIQSVSSGQVDNRNGDYIMSLKFNQQDGTSFSGKYSGDFKIQNDTISGNQVISGVAKQKSGTVDLDFEVVGKFKAQAQNTLNFTVPTLTAQNSMDMSMIIGGTGQAAAAPKGKTPIFVNNNAVTTDAPPFMQNGRLMVPIRFVGEALNGEVRWVNPTVHITRGENVISMNVGKTSYTASGQLAKMDTVPVLKNGRVFVPVRFVAEALNCTVNYTNNTVYIYTK